MDALRLIQPSRCSSNLAQAGPLPLPSLFGPLSRNSHAERLQSFSVPPSPSCLNPRSFISFSCLPDSRRSHPASFLKASEEDASALHMTRFLGGECYPFARPTISPPSRSNHQRLKAKASSSIDPETQEKWMKNLPDQGKALYAHSLPCIEAWLRSLGFEQDSDDAEKWILRRADWHAELSMDITELMVRYLKSGPGNLQRDVERKFSYALSRQDLENAILGGP
eukprot:TRINITY_DN26383_c0_g1_i1.p1 TRINITY_DN26383_c0_g1~~TRINITY_DN26383_c0_g1_i1.p1  ORF type:complete len:224 (-),score=15.89 TRINITY_DN26383_c0_g1_i1:436-1107(-)